MNETGNQPSFTVLAVALMAWQILAAACLLELTTTDRTRLAPSRTYPPVKRPSSLGVLYLMCV